MGTCSQYLVRICAFVVSRNSRGSRQIDFCRLDTHAERLSSVGAHRPVKRHQFVAGGKESLTGTSHPIFAVTSHICCFFQCPRSGISHLPLSELCSRRRSRKKVVYTINGALLVRCSRKSQLRADRQPRTDCNLMN